MENYCAQEIRMLLFFCQTRIKIIHAKFWWNFGYQANSMVIFEHALWKELKQEKKIEVEKFCKEKIYVNFFARFKQLGS